VEEPSKMTRIGSRLNFNQKSPEKVILRTVLIGCKKVKKSNMEGWPNTTELGKLRAYPNFSPKQDNSLYQHIPNINMILMVHRGGHGV